MEPFEALTAKALGDVAHGFFGHGSTQKECPDQFGYGGDGDPAAIRKSRAEAVRWLVPDAKLAAPHQVHSPDVVTVDQAWEDNPVGRPVADALVTATPRIVLGIVTADCAPILFADHGAGVVGAAHAGWRGAHAGVIENTVSVMEALGANRSSIAAGIGPTIAQASYEVDRAFLDQFTDADAHHFKPAPMRSGLERWLFDLPGYCAARLVAAGIRKIENLERDTYRESDHFYSYRRATQLGEPNYGRQISMIGLQ
ncbi:peptidoglycan editing factor PgeF [Erythrobacter crassostreae]|uniref:Purine nucleoside phosphorylase n=1 Tax=Erythrobacter crassostreae TaxID=2828328 RepID=A0A9X1F441_9SPHN|nr:peptidoglycan editing factor PgeF [Erythrobacter crassostrea]MBV7258455.1 peptidoglycan editing factor PgeF [Erythrobacter crassostrea]